MQVLITGMHRSGTSVIARLLADCGCYFGRPEDLMPAKPDNPAGFWEHLEAFEINEGILDAAGVAWDTAVGGELDRLSQPDRSRSGARIREFVTKMMSHEVWAVKDPRLAMTFPLWRPLLSEPIVLWCVRNPVEIGKSLKGRNGFPIALGIALWEAYTIQALRAFAGTPVVIASYNDLLRNPASEVRRVVESLNEVGRGTIRVPDDSTIEPVVRTGLHRSVTSPEQEEQFLTEPRRRLWALSRTAEGWSGQSEVPALSELSREEILRHRDFLRLDNQPVLIPEAVLNEGLGHIEARSAERMTVLDAKLAELSHRCDQILETADAQNAASGERLAKLQAGLGGVTKHSKEQFQILDARLTEMSAASTGELERLEARFTEDRARLESRLTEMSDSSLAYRARLDDRLTEMSDASKKELERLEALFTEGRAKLDDQLTEMSDSSLANRAKLDDRLTEMSDSSRVYREKLENRLTEFFDAFLADRARLESRLAEVLQHWDESARAEKAELNRRLAESADENSGLGAELEKRDRELELITRELERHQAVLLEYRSSKGGRILDWWWRLRSND